MSTITLQNFRVGSDLTVKVRLKDGGVAIDWSTLSGIRAVLYSDAQSSIAGRCDVTVDGEDPTLLVCRYAATKMQYLGVNRIVVSAKYMGVTKTYDKPAFTFVRWSEDQAGEEITIEDPEVTVEIDVEDVSSSILQEAVDAAFSAADRANEAAEAAEHMVDIHTGPAGKSAYEVAVEEGYTGTEEEWLASLKGPVGETPDISIGTVTTVEPGTPAAASMSGTPEAPVLNLSIPKGLVGATPNFTVGTVTTGQPGTPVVVTITGTPEAPVLNVTIPQGMQGNTGSSVDYPYELVNNLTTNDATKGLSAAQGYVLDGKVSQLEAKVTENVFNYTFVDGNYLNANGEEVSFWNGSCTDFIEAAKGDDFYFTGQTTGLFQNVCGYNASKVFVRVLYQGAGDNTKITITDPTIAYVRACANKNDSGKSFIKMNYNSLGMLSNRIDALGENIKTSVYDGMTSDFVSGYCINHSGQKTAGTLFGYKEFSVLAGAVIVFSGQVNEAFAAIAKKISSTSYKELVAATATTVATFTYTATEDMTIAVSFYPAYSRSINIDTLLIGSNRANIVKLQNDFQSLEDGMEIREIDLGFLFDKVAVIGDSMSVATMDGYTAPLGASWLSFLAKRWDCQSKQFYAMGGTSAYQWLNDTAYGLGKMLADDTVYNAYFIAYGHNDSASVGDATDEAAPVTISGGVPSCPDGYSFCAYYKAIINQIRTKAPHAMIFCLSQYDYAVAPGGWHSQYGEAVVDVAEALYNGGDKLVHHLDTGGVPDTDLQLGTHYSTIGYAYIAKRINDEANKVIYQYRADTEIKTFGVYNL